MESQISKTASKFICTETQFFYGGMASEPQVSACFAYKCSVF